jgi:colicin import membrane protein
MPDFEDLQSAISTIKGLENGSIDPDTITLDEEDQKVEDVKPEGEEQTDPTPEDQTEDPNPDDQEETIDEETPDESNEEGTKKVQTPEENRKFAEQRRQQELEKRVQEELNKRLQDTPEMRQIQQLQELGFDVNTLVEQATLAQLQQQSQETGIPLEYLQQQYQNQQSQTQMQQQMADMQAQLWEYKMQTEATQVQQKYSSLTDEDMQSAIDYMVNTLQRTDLPLEQAVMAVHGEKIMQSLRDQARNEVLAEKAGRKTPLTPQGGKAPSNPTLTPEEKQVAALMGISEEDYLKYK